MNRFFLSLRLFLVGIVLFSVLKSSVDAVETSRYTIESFSNVLSSFKDEQVELCATFGFAGERGNSLYDALFGEDSGLDLTAIYSNSPLSLAKLMLIERTVGFFHSSEILGYDVAISPFVQTLIDSAVVGGRKKKVVLVLETTKLRTVEKLKEEIARSVDVAGAAKQIEINYVVVSSTTDRLAETKASVQQLMTSDSQTNKKNVKALRQQIKSHPKVLAESVPSINRFSDPELEIKSALECKKIEDSFLSETKLQLGPSLLRRTLFANMNNTIANLNDTLVSINQYNFHAHTEAFNTYGTSVSMKNLAHRIRGELGIALAPFYLKFAESLMLESLAQFDRRVGRLAGSSNFKKVLNLLIDLSVTEFEVNLNNLRTDFSKMVKMRADSGVLSVPTGKSLSINTMGYFETKSFRDNFRSYLKERRDDTVDSMFLAGTYNPFIREQGFPPIHINLNYLIDPSALVYSAAYDKLYDEHAIGPCDSRADPLHIPGTARFPFDPNSHPTPTEVEIPWWKIVQEFFISD